MAGWPRSSRIRRTLVLASGRVMSVIAISHAAELPYPSLSCASAASNRASTDACAAVNFASISPSDRSTVPHAAGVQVRGTRAVQVVQSGARHPQRLRDTAQPAVCGAHPEPPPPVMP